MQKKFFVSVAEMMSDTETKMAIMFSRAYMEMCFGIYGLI